MIKECKVIFYNKFLNILVFDYDGKRIQTTIALDNDQSTVFVKYKDGKYEIVNKDDYNKYNREMIKKNASTKISKKEKEPEDVSE